MERMEQSKILCIESDHSSLSDLQKQLDDAFEFHGAESEDKALEMIMELGPYEAVITNSKSNNNDNYPLLEKIKKLSPASVSILLTGENDVGIAKQALDEGRIYRYLVKPCSQEELIETIHSAVSEKTSAIHKRLLEQEAKDLITASDDLRSTSMFDPELGIGSMDAMHLELEFTHNIALRYQRVYSIALFEIDVFNDYSSHYGTKASKLAHKLMAEHIRHSCRATDRIYRFSKDSSIMLILPETPAEGAVVMAERVVDSFVSRNIPNSRSQHNLLTLSGSLACYEPALGTDVSHQDLEDEALLYLHVAQASGGNCVSSTQQHNQD